MDYEPVAPSDLRNFADYLRGLASLCDAIASAARADRALSGRLEAAVEKLETTTIAWAPLHHEGGLPGFGWESVAMGARELLDRLDRDNDDEV